MSDIDLTQSIKSRISALEATRKPWESYWQECMDYALPGRATWNENGEEARRPSVNLYSTKAVALLRMAADGFIGYMAPRSLPFFHLGVADPSMADRYGVADFLESVERILYQELARARFYESLSEFVPDALCPGTASMFIDDDVKRRTSHFSTRNPFEVYIMEDGYGNVDQCLRKSKMTIRQMAHVFPFDQLHQTVQNRIKDGKLDERVTVAHLVYPREGVEPSPLARRTNKPWASFYVDLDNNKTMDEGGFDEYPWIHWRYTKDSQETYGRSPTMDALISVKMANQMDRSRIDLAQRSIQPPMSIPEAMKNGEVDFTPNGWNFVPKGERIEPIAVGANYPISIDVVNRMDQCIADHYHADFFLMLNNAMAQGKQLTATQVMEMQGEKSAVLSTIIGNFESSVLNPVIMRTLAILSRRGVLPEPPRALMEGGQLKIEYVGPLAQAQKKYNQSAGLRQGIELAMAVAQVAPDALLRIDFDKLIKQGLEGDGVSASIIREDDDVAKIKQLQLQQQQQAQQQAMAMEQQKNVMGNIDKLNQPQAPGSMLEKMGQAAAAGGQA